MVAVAAAVAVGVELALAAKVYEKGAGNLLAVKMLQKAY